MKPSQGHVQPKTKNPCLHKTLPRLIELSQSSAVQRSEAWYAPAHTQISAKVQAIALTLMGNFASLPRTHCNQTPVRER